MSPNVTSATTAHAESPAGRSDLQATGQPDTPTECITALLQRALRLGGDAADQRACIEAALAIASGQDAYLEAISTPPLQVQKCIAAGHASTRGHKSPALRHGGARPDPGRLHTAGSEGASGGIAGPRLVRRPQAGAFGRATAPCGRPCVSSP